MDDAVKMIIAGQVRHVLTLAAGALVTWGLLQGGEQSTQFVQVMSGMVLAVIGMGWSWYQKNGVAGLKVALTDLARRRSLGAILFALMLGPLLAGCDAMTAKQIAAQGIDLTCANLSSLDLAARYALQARNANGTSMRIESEAVATIQAACDQRGAPGTDTAKALRIVSAAVAKIVALEAAN